MVTAKVTSLAVSRAFSEGGGRQMELGLAGNWRPKEAGGGARQAGRGTHASTIGGIPQFLRLTKVNKTKLTEKGPRDEV